MDDIVDDQGLFQYDSFFFQNDSFHQQQEEQPIHYHTSYQPQQQFPTRTEAYKTVAQTKYDPKNIPKIFGNYISRKVTEIETKGLQHQKIIPMKLRIFKNKKSKGRQADYQLQDFRDMLQDEASANFVRKYLEEELFLEILQSKRILEPMIYIDFIEQYIRGTKNPNSMISNRTTEHLKIPQRQNPN